MCNHIHKKTYINGLSDGCNLADYFKSLSTKEIEFPDLPLDSNGKCIFHSSNLKWKRKHHCGERFWELLHLMAKDSSLKDIDFREFILTGLSYDDKHGYQKDKVPLKNENIIAITKIHLKKPLRMQGAKFYDDVLIQDFIAEEAVDFDEAVFKGIVTMNRCHLKGMISFINGCRFEHNFWLEDCLFEESADFHNVVVMQQFYMTHVTFHTESLFVGLSQIAPDLICSFTEVTFNNYTSFSNAQFNSSVAFDNCRFLGETHFENVAFRKRLQVISPVIGDKLYFMATKPDVKLFENAVDFELTIDAFKDVGQLIFQHVNLFHFNSEFKSQLKDLELNHKVDLQEGCLLYRASIERTYEPYTRFNQVIITNICQALANYFETNHTIYLYVDISRDLRKEAIKVIYHTEENM